jgi:hypothetical protein
MNDYLHYLDSNTSASRDRNVRKAAREARDSFVVEKKKNVEARFRVSSYFSLMFVVFPS